MFLKMLVNCKVDVFFPASDRHGPSELSSIAAWESRVKETIQTSGRPSVQHPIVAASQSTAASHKSNSHLP